MQRKEPERRTEEVRAEEEEIVGQTFLKGMQCLLLFQGEPGGQSAEEISCRA
jgi:hypothetical protein